MIRGIKDMILRCIERMQAGRCASCDNMSVCPAGRWQKALQPPQRGISPATPSFLSFFSEVVDAADRHFGLADSSFRAQVEKVTANLLPAGASSVERVSAELGVTRQTLYRRLKTEGVTFEELMESTRKRLAIRYLKQEKLTVKAAAYRLGFSDPAAFSRAFKRWTGASPVTFRH